MSVLSNLSKLTPFSLGNKIDKAKSVSKLSMMPKQIFLDYQSTTPVDLRVFKAMEPLLKNNFGNPHSRTHSFGWSAENAVENGREKIADLIGCDKAEIIITSGATESNNMAIKGFVDFYLKNLESDDTTQEKIHIITSTIEHKTVLDTLRRMESPSVAVTYLPVKSNGLVDPIELKKAIRPTTKLVSIMAVNNEIGTIQPLREIGKICKENKIKFHTDAAQGFGKIPLDVNDLNIDMMSISGHKIYGPKGVGALYLRRRPRVRITPLFNGGGQERGLRSGTVAPFLVAGLGKAAQIAKTEMKQNFKNLEKKSDFFISKIKKEIKDVVINGENTFPGCVNLSFPHVEGESLLMKLKDFALSSGSACTSSSLEPSYVLRALGTNDVLAHCSIRFGFGKDTTFKEVDNVAKQTIKSVKDLRKMSPLYEMEKKGIDLSSIKWTA